MIDIHSHILPEIDDGARSMEEALELARMAAEDGIEQMVSTPHMFNGLSHNPQPAEILQRVAALNEAIAAADRFQLKILPGNEAHVCHDLPQQVRDKQVTTLNLGPYMLVEFPSLAIPVAAEGLFDALQLEGVRPILVHPERNTQVQRDPSIVADFIAIGVLIQVTAMSVTGQFGPAAKNCSDVLLRHRCVHFLATDTHRPKSRPPILSKARDAAASIVGRERARALVDANPRAVVYGTELQVESPLPFESSGNTKRSFISRLFQDK